MLVIISPSKTQDFSAPEEDISNKIHELADEPQLLEDSKMLVEELRKMSVDEISDLMEVSENVASLNFRRYQTWTTPFNTQNAKQALLTFQGDVYTDIDVESFSEEDFEFAQRHLRIISGLYGLLKPLNLIQPYRLEMKTRLNNPRGNNLYEFWGNKITSLVNRELENDPQKVLVNLASTEYAKSINVQDLNANIITPVFKEMKQGQYKVIAVYAKRARGMMANYIIQNKIEDVEEIKSFNEKGYQFNEEMSSSDEWVFIR